MNFIDFKKLMPRALAKYNMERETRAALICARFRSLAPSILGEKIAEKVQPKCFKHHTLYLSVPNSLWAQRVYIHRNDLIMKMNLHLEKEWIHEIRTVVETNAPLSS